MSNSIREQKTRTVYSIDQILGFTSSTEHCGKILLLFDSIKSKLILMNSTKILSFNLEPIASLIVK